MNSLNPVTPVALTSSPNARACAVEEEQALIAGLLNDEAGAWRDFSARYSRLIYRCITRVTARFPNVVNQEDVREIYAMLCVQLLANDKHKLRTFELARGNRLGSWLGMLSIHTAYDFLRTVKREPKRGTLIEAETLAADHPDPFDNYMMRQRAQLLSELLAGLSEKDREFVALYFGEGLDPSEVARRMSISVKTVYSKKHKIQNRLEALLSDRQLAA